MGFRVNGGKDRVGAALAQAAVLRGPAYDVGSSDDPDRQCCAGQAGQLVNPVKDVHGAGEAVSLFR